MFLQLSSLKLRVRSAASNHWASALVSIYCRFNVYVLLCLK